MILKKIFRQEVYQDKWLLIIGIPLLTLFVQHIGLSWRTTQEWIQDEAYLPVLFYNLIGIAIIFLLNKVLILWLDKVFPYRPRFKKRVVLQLLLSLGLTTAIGELHSYIYVSQLNGGISWDSRYSTDLPFAIVLTVLFNLIYIGLYLHYESKQQEEVSAAPAQSVRLEVSAGSKNLLLESAEIALIFSQNKITQVLCLGGKRYYMNRSLKQVYQLLDTATFFQANRQVIIHRQLIKGYQKLPNRKLELLLHAPDIFSTPIYISKEKTPHFLQWLSV